MKYAVVENNIVTNIIDIEETIVENMINSVSENNIEYVQCDDNVKIGDEYLGNGEFNLFQTPDDRIDELQEKYDNFKFTILDKVDRLNFEIIQLQEVVADLLLLQSKKEGGK